jgi:hypothetical protein
VDAQRHIDAEERVVAIVTAVLWLSKIVALTFFIKSGAITAITINGKGW